MMSDIKLSTKVQFVGIILFCLSLSSISCTVKTGNYFFNNKDFRRFGTDCFDVWEFETSSPRFFDDKFDVSGSIGILNLDRSNENYHEHHYHYHWFYESSTDLIDLSLTARLYPFEILGIQPYIGIGGSWYWLGTTDNHGHSHYTHYNGQNHYYYDDVDRNTITDGFYYHTVSGILIPLHEFKSARNKAPRVYMVLEHRFDFAKKSDVYDLSGNKVLMGIGIRF
ncbi:MAG: hypothetical protein GY869_20620 [Planctomycetes bacterium]|nr:hypothetical protein [Planctomycetota bacterium]